jgi:OPA family glycerol-3-phosphate transporter-like MFS transporter
VGDVRQLRRWQAATLLLLFVGYSGYYLCRSNLSVVTPLLLDEMAERGIDREQARVSLGTLISLGTLAYALGKFIFGATGDLIGGRRNFLGGMSGAVFFTVVFAMGGSFPILTIAWIGNRLVQASGWPGLVKIGGRWFDYRWHGTVMGILSLSYLFGDAAARAFMGVLLRYELGWRSVFFVTAGVLAGILLVCFFFLRESPRAIGAVEGAPSPTNVYGEKETPGLAAESPQAVGAVEIAPGPTSAYDEKEAPGLAAILGPLLRSPAFWYVCALSLATTFLRETFNNWIPEYLTTALGFTRAQAATWSGAFPFLGGCSVLAAGHLSDLLGRAGRSLILFTGLLLSGVCLLFLSQSGTSPNAGLAVGTILATGFFLIGPYSYLAGAIALDFGGKQGGATACGIIDGIGYLGGAIAGAGIAKIVFLRGWPTAWGVLSAVAIASCVAAALYWRDQLRLVPRPTATETTQ